MAKTFSTVITRSFGVAFATVLAIAVPTFAPRFAWAETKAAAVDIQEAVMRDVALLSIEDDREAALLRLQSRPREQVIKTLENELIRYPVGNTPKAVYRAARLLELQELWPTLVERLKKTEDWSLVVALNQLATSNSKQSQLSTIYVKNLAQPHEPSVKMAMIDGLAKLHMRIEPKLYDLLINDDSYEVRMSIVQGFLANRNLYSLAEQTRRFKLAFALKPYQVRLEALNAFAALDTQSRRDLASVGASETCANEKNTEVKEACARVKAGGGHK